MPTTPPTRDSAPRAGTDASWAGAARFLEGRVPPGLRVVAPSGFQPLLGPLAEPDPAALPDWAVVAVAAPGTVPPRLVRRLLAETTPVYANEGYVVFARRPTFGLANMRDTVPVRRLAETAAAEEASAAPAGPTLLEASTPKASAPPEAAMVPTALSASPGIPRGGLSPEALAQQVPVPPARSLPPPSVVLPSPEPVTTPAAPPQPPAEPAPPAAEPAAPPTDEAWGTLPARVAALLAPAAGLRVAAIGPAARRLAEAALPPSAVLAAAGEGSPEGAFDAVLLLPQPGTAGPETALAARLLRPGGRVLAVAENAESLGRRLAAALGRAPGPPGLPAAALRGAVHAAGLAPLRLDGHALDPWRATSDAPPEGLAPQDPAAALLEEAGEAAGPRHAAWLLFLAAKA